MTYFIFVIFIVLSVTKLGIFAATTPPPLTFDCVNDKITNIAGSNIKADSLLIENELDGKLCHYTNSTCYVQKKQKLYMVYDPDETQKNSNFVAGHVYRYILECKAGYMAKGTATAFEINRLSTKEYKLQTGTGSPLHDAIQIRIAKKNEDTKLDGKVYVGDELVLRITGPASSSLKPLTCKAYNKESNKYTLWDSNKCKSFDIAVMPSNWKTVNTHTIEMELIAFRFVDSFSVVIECSAYVCPVIDTECGKTINNCLTTVAPTQADAPGGSSTIAPVKANRRRRSNDYKKKIASITFTVVDDGRDSSGCAGTYALCIKMCTAKGTHLESYRIWDVTGSCYHDSSIIGDKWVGVDQRTLEIDMYGFYFPKSSHVTIECLTTVCTNENNANCKNDCMTIQRRRRRDTETSKNDTFSHSVQVAFDVAIEGAGVNSAISKEPKKMVYSLIAIMLYIVMQI